MTLTRRTLLQGAVAGTALAGLGGRMAFASDSATLGEKTLTTLSDGNLVLPVDFTFNGVSEADRAPIFKQFGFGDGMLEPECNVTLLQDGERTILFDAGSGPAFMPSVGRLPDALDEMGLFGRRYHPCGSLPMRTPITFGACLMISTIRSLPRRPI